MSVGKASAGAAVGMVRLGVCSTHGRVALKDVQEWPDEWTEVYGRKLVTGQCPACGSTVEVPTLASPDSPEATE